MLTKKNKINKIFVLTLILCVLAFLAVVVAQSFSGAVVLAESPKVNSLPMNEGSGAISKGYGSSPFNLDSESWTSPSDEDLWQDDAKFGKVFKSNRQHYNGAGTFDLSATKGNASLAMWINIPKSQNEFNYLIKDYDSANESQWNWNLYVHQDHKVYLEIKNNGGAWLELTNTLVNTGNWLHFALVIDRDNDKVISYVNGIQEKNLDMSVSGAYGKTQLDSLTNHAGTIVGAKSNVGLISHIDYYNRAISQNTVSSIIGEGNQHFAFNLNEGSGWFANESNYNATRFDAGSWTESSGGNSLENWQDDVKFGKSLTAKAGFSNGAWSLPFGGAEASFSVWIKMPTDAVGDQIILADTGERGTKFKIYSHGGDNHKLYLYMPDASQQYYDLTVSGVNKGEWLHFAMTIDKANKHVKTYVNGILEKDGMGWDFSMLDTEVGTIIGANDDTVLSHLNIYNYVIDDKEISDLAGKINSQNSFNLNEGKGSYAYDNITSSQRLVAFSAKDLWEKDSKMGNILAPGKTLSNGAYTFDIKAPKSTLGVWIKVPTVMDNPEIIFQDTDFSAFSWKIYVHNVTHTLFIQIENGVQGNAADDIFYELSTQSLNTGEWMHIAIAFNNQIGKINTFVNGQLDKTTPAKLNFAAKAGAIVGGALNKMAISHIDYYNAELQDWQIAKYLLDFDAYNTNPYVDDVLFNYNLTENTGAIMYDSSKSQNHIIMPFAEWQQDDNFGVTVGQSTKLNIPVSIPFDKGLSMTAKINLTESSNSFRVLWSVNLPQWGSLTLMVNSIGKLYLEGRTIDNQYPISLQAGNVGDVYTDIINKGWLTITVTIDVDNNSIKIYIGGGLMAVLDSANIGQLKSLVGDSVWVGDDASGAHGLDGNIADVGCYSKVLNASDIDRIDKNIIHLTQDSFDYQSDVANVAPDAVAGYNADEGEGHKISDVWGNNHATLGKTSVWDKNGLGGYNLAGDKDSFAYLDKPIDMSGDFTISLDMRNYGSTSNFTFIMSCGGDKDIDPATGLDKNTRRWDIHLTPNGYVCLQNQGAWGGNSIVFPYDTRGKGWFNFAISCQYNADTSMYDFTMYYNGLPVVRQSRATALSAPQQDFSPKKEYLFTLMSSQEGLFTMDGQASNLRFYDSAISPAEIRKVADGDGKITPPPSYLPPSGSEEDEDFPYQPDAVVGVEFLPLKRVSFEIGDVWGNDYPQVKVTLNDGSSGILPREDYTVSGFDTSTVGKKTITVAYGEYTKQFTVTVDKHKVATVEFPPLNKVIFKLGDEWGDAYPKVIVTRTNGAVEELPREDYTVSGFDTSTVGKKTITVAYGEYTKQFTVTVDKHKVATVEFPPLNKVIFKLGDEWGDAYPKVIVTRTNGAVEELSREDYTVSGFDTSTAGEKTITVTYGEHTKQFIITVEADQTVDNGMSPGAITGISLGSVGGAALIAAVAFFFIKKKKSIK